MPVALHSMERTSRKKPEKRLSASRETGKRILRSRFPDLTGMTVGTWRILYESTGEEKPVCMCKCLRCGVKKIIPTCKFLKGYILNCPECRIRQASLES